MATSYLSLVTSLSSDTLFSSYVSAQDSNWLKVDTFASTAAGSISVLGSNITSLSSSLSVLGGNVVSLSTALSSAMLDISALSSAISNVNLSAALGISGSLTIASDAWVGSMFSTTLSNLGAYDAIFFGPYGSGDKAILDAANPFVSVSGSDIVFTVTETPLSTVTLKYYIDRGRQVTQLATPVLNLQDDIAYWDVIPNATEYDVMYNGAVLVSTSSTSVDLSNYFSEDGSYDVTVIAKAIGYYDSNESNSVTYVISTPVGDSIYGVSGLYQSSPSLTRTDDAVGLSAAVNSSTGLVSSDFDSVFPWNEATVETVGGNKFLKMPDMWFRVGVDGSNRITDVAVSKSQGDTGNWYKVDSFYYGCYGGSVDANSKLASVSGVARQHTKTRSEFRTYAAANGSGYHQLDLYHHTVMMFLWLIEWANKDSQSIIRGRDGSYGDAAVNTGGTDSLSTPSGFNTSTGQMRYHYIEDFVGNYLEWVDGSVGNGTAGGAQYVTADPSKFSDDTTGLNTLAYNSPAANGNCLVSLGWDANNLFLVLPKEVTNNSNYDTYYCDYVATNNRACLDVGACWIDSAAINGVTYFDRNNVSRSYSYIGGRLLYKPAA